MPQLVGLECAICNERVASMLDGEFCATCGNPVHKRCATPRVAKSGACAVCGADAIAGAAHRQRSQQEATEHTRHVRRYHVVWALVCLGVGLALLAVGLASLVWAVVSEGKTVVIWTGAIIVGAALMARGLAHVYALWRMRRDTGREQVNIYAAARPTRSTERMSVSIRREEKRLTAVARGGAARVVVALSPDGTAYTKKREAVSGATGEAGLASIAFVLGLEFGRTGTRMLSWEREADAAWNRHLIAAGFVVHRRKIFVERDLTTLGAVASSFTWRTLIAIGDREFLWWLERAAEGDPATEGEPRDPEREYQELLDHAGERLDRTLWRVAVLQGEAVGVVLPHVVGGDPPEGTLLYVGVLPECRKRGIGARLHLTGLSLLAGAGARRYFGSTDVLNEPMARVFARNECEISKTQLVYRVP